MRPAISTMRNALGSVSSSGTFPATVVMASIFNSGERMASSNARASSTPGSVSMMTLKGPPAAAGLEPEASPSRAKLLAAKVAAEDVTNSRRVIRNAFDSITLVPRIRFPSGRHPAGCPEDISPLAASGPPDSRRDGGATD